MTVPISQLILLLHFPWISIAIHLIGPELIGEIGIEIKRRKHEIQTLNPTYSQ